MARRTRTAGEPTPGSPADALPEADPANVARSIVLARLTAAPRTRSELATTLRERGIPDDIATCVLDRFEEVGLVDDASFARAWVASRHRVRGSARSVLRQELRRKGVDDVRVSEALEEIDDAAERERARALASRKLAGMTAVDPGVRARRVASMLARRGYPTSVAMGVVRELLGEEAVTAREPEA